MDDGFIEPNTGHLYGGPRLTVCRGCGQPKWAYLGGDRPAEPLCGLCEPPRASSS